MCYLYRRTCPLPPLSQPPLLCPYGSGRQLGQQQTRCILLKGTGWAILRAVRVHPSSFLRCMLGRKPRSRKRASQKRGVSDIPTYMLLRINTDTDKQKRTCQAVVWPILAHVLLYLSVTTNSRAFCSATILMDARQSPKRV